MPTNNFIFNGVSASDYDIEVLDFTEEFTSRDGNGIVVSGRTGELYSDNGRYENIKLTYHCALTLGTEDAESKLKEFNARLLSFIGNYHLTDTFDDSVAYRIGRYTGAIEPKISRTGDGLVRVDFTFNCNPKKFLASGATPSIFESTEKVIPSYHVFSDFSTTVQENLLPSIRSKTSYSQADISDMHYIVIGLTFGENEVHDIRIESNDSEEFFASVLRLTPNATPYDYNGWAGVFTTYTSKMFKFDSARGGYPDVTIACTTPYIVAQRTAPFRLYVDDELYFEDNYFDFYSLTNPTFFGASPLLRMKVPANTFNDYLCVINGTSIELNHSSDVSAESFAINYLTFDAETMNAYSLPEDNEAGYLINANRFVKVSGYSMDLQSGENEIWLGNWCKKLEIIPRWWTL